ncbi:hypothetical protein ACTMU2_26265 [Cupriavidus basilensis]
MSIRAQDVVPISEARSRLTELAEDVVAGAEKLPTKNGTAFVALVDARKLDYYHDLERREHRPATHDGGCRAGYQGRSRGPGKVPGGDAGVDATTSRTSQMRQVDFAQTFQERLEIIEAFMLHQDAASAAWENGLAMGADLQVS